IATTLAASKPSRSTTSAPSRMSGCGTGCSMTTRSSTALASRSPGRAARSCATCRSRSASGTSNIAIAPKGYRKTAPPSCVGYQTSCAVRGACGNAAASSFRFRLSTKAMAWKACAAAIHARLHAECHSAHGKALALVRNLRLDEHLEQIERLAPSEIASLSRNRVGHAFLDDVDLGADHHLLDVDGDGHRADESRVEAVGVDDALAGHELQVLAAEGMARAGREVRERHVVAAAHARVHLVDLRGEAV